MTSHCATAPTPSRSASFLLVRHAEVTDEDPDDPGLSAAGLARAAALARHLQHTALAGIEVTEFQRTQQTAAPTAVQQKRRPVRYFSRGDAMETTQRWQQHYRHGQVLVIGDGETLNALAAALCRCAVSPRDTSEYDHVMIVTPAASGPGQVVDKRLPPS
ncbi:MAG: histidine phosphatase family protein [Pseudoxanthomonas sp.]